MQKKTKRAIQTALGILAASACVAAVCGNLSRETLLEWGGRLEMCIRDRMMIGLGMMNTASVPHPDWQENPSLAVRLQQELHTRYEGCLLYTSRCV